MEALQVETCFLSVGSAKKVNKARLYAIREIVLTSVTLILLFCGKDAGRCSAQSCRASDVAFIYMRLEACLHRIAVLFGW
jgi:hypothetical protein